MNLILFKVLDVVYDIKKTGFDCILMITRTHLNLSIRWLIIDN